MSRYKLRDYSHFVEDILNNYVTYNDVFTDIATFTGPSIYFHNKALSLRNNKDTERFLESVYSVLVSWGMHRMGTGGAKMLHFNQFYDSIAPVLDDIEQAKKLKYQTITVEGWQLVHQIYDKIQIMDGKTHIVGKSKVLAHLLPNIIAPIDRQYTLAYLHGSKYININNQWSLMKSVMTDFYFKVASDTNFQRFSDDLIDNNNGIGWNTSRLKLIDNLVIGAIKTKQ